MSSLNNNNNNNNRNNRRRGRGNRNQGGNSAQMNRIDSRARGNAPQMLDKYKKLAQDAHHNGDRVQMEYYLQFADHYFRVIADNKARVDEQRGAPRRNDDRDQAEEYGDDDLDFGSVRRTEPSRRSHFNEQNDAPRGDGQDGGQGQEGESSPADGRDESRDDGRDSGRGEQQPRQPTARRQPRKPRENGRDDNRAERSERAPRAARPERTERSDGPPAEKPAETRADKPVRTRKPRKVADNDGAEDRGKDSGKDKGSIDSSILPPSIRSDDSRSDAKGSAKGGANGSDSDGTLETVG